MTALLPKPVAAITALLPLLLLPLADTKSAKLLHHAATHLNSDDTISVEPAELTSVLRHIGYTHANSAITHVHVRYSIMPLLEVGQRILTELRWLDAIGLRMGTTFNTNIRDNYYEDAYDSPLSNVAHQSATFRHITNNAIDRASATHSVLMTASPSRGKRFLSDVIGAVVSTAHTVWSINQMYDLQRQVNKLQGSINGLIYSLSHKEKVSSEFDAHINALNSLTDDFRDAARTFNQTAKVSLDNLLQIMNRWTHKFDDATRLAVNFVDTLFDQRLHIHTFNHTALRRAFNGAARTAAAAQYHLAIDSPADLYQLPVSFIASPLGYIDIFIHVPATRDKTLLPLYEYIQSPIPLTPAADLVLHLHPSAAAIAVHSDPTDRHAPNQYFTMDQNELWSCLRIGYRYFCPMANVLMTGANSSCLASIYEHDLTAMETRCDKFVALPHPSARQISANKFLTFTARASTFYIHCSNRPDNQLPFEGTQILHLPPGCSASTNSFTLTGALNPATNHLAIRSKWHSPLASMSFFRTRNSSDILHAYHEITKTTKAKVDIQSLRNTLQQLHNAKNTAEMIINGHQPSLDDWWIIVSTIANSAVLSVTTAAFMWTRFKARFWPTATTTPDAPPANSSTRPPGPASATTAGRANPRSTPPPSPRPTSSSSTPPSPSLTTGPATSASNWPRSSPSGKRTTAVAAPPTTSTAAALLRTSQELAKRQLPATSAFPSMRS